MQVKILGSLLGTVKSNLVPVSLWPEGQTFPNNMAFVRSHLLQLLSTSFPNMTEVQVQRIVDKMFELVDNMTAFKNHCRDFLVQVSLFGPFTLHLVLWYTVI
jgi:exportin-1